MYKIDFRTYYMCRGIEALIDKFRPWLKKYGWPVYGVSSSPVPKTPHETVLQSAFQDLSVISQTFTGDKVLTEDRDTYEEVSKFLVGTYSALVSETVQLPIMEQRLLTFLHRIPDHFVSLLEKREPIAMALLARNRAMFVYLEESAAWWIHGTEENRVYVRAVRGILSLMPSEWVWTMEWPLMVISKKLKLERAWT